MADLIDRQALMQDFCGYDLNECVKYGNKTAEQQNNSYSTMMMYEIAYEIEDAPAVDAVEVSEIKAYLQRKLDEWNALGDRKFESANMWGYNFIMACFDDLSSYGERREDK